MSPRATDGTGAATATAAETGPIATVGSAHRGRNARHDLAASPDRTIGRGMVTATPRVRSAVTGRTVVCAMSGATTARTTSARRTASTTTDRRLVIRPAGGRIVPYATSTGTVRSATIVRTGIAHDSSVAPARPDRPDLIDVSGRRPDPWLAVLRRRPGPRLAVLRRRLGPSRAGPRRRGGPWPVVAERGQAAAGPPISPTAR